MKNLGFESITEACFREAIQGDPNALEDIVAAAGPRIRAMVVVRLSPDLSQFHAIDDLVQQILLALSQGIPTMHTPTLTALKSFASTIVARTVAAYVRRPDAAKSRQAVSLDSTVQNGSWSEPFHQLLPASGDSPRSSAQRLEQVKLAIMELGRLRPRYREVISLAFFDQLPIADIAERMEISRPAASMLLIRAVKALRRSLTGSSQTGKLDHE